MEALLHLHPLLLQMLLLLLLIPFFHELYQKDAPYRMISIGKGELQEAFEQKIKQLGFEDAICRIESIPNDQVWKYYCMSDVMVNLNRVEIFGMAILEAMYYGCPVVARRAPGPEYILTDGKDGFLCDDSEQIIANVEHLCGDIGFHGKIARAAKERIAESFVWQATAQAMMNVIAKKQDNKAKVLHILHELHPSGAEMMICNAYPYWKDECTCTIMATGKIKGPFADTLENTGYDIAYVPTKNGGKGAKMVHLLFILMVQ